MATDEELAQANLTRVAIILQLARNPGQTAGMLARAIHGKAHRQSQVFCQLLLLETWGLVRRREGTGRAPIRWWLTSDEENPDNA
jgi:hypothetical protein